MRGKLWFWWYDRRLWTAYRLIDFALYIWPRGYTRDTYIKHMNQYTDSMNAEVADEYRRRETIAAETHGCADSVRELRDRP